MITVYQAQSSFDAKLIQDQLAFADIQSHIMGDLLQGGVGELQAHGLVKLMVDEEDLEKSIQVIEDWKNTKISEDESATAQSVSPKKNNRAMLMFVIVFVILGFYFLTEL